MRGSRAEAQVHFLGRALEELRADHAMEANSEVMQLKMQVEQLGMSTSALVVLGALPAAPTHTPTHATASPPNHVYIHIHPLTRFAFVGRDGSQGSIII